MTLTVGSLCSGYEATGLGLALAGWDHLQVDTVAGLQRDGGAR